MYPEYSETSIYYHSRKPEGEISQDAHYDNPGRPCKLNKRDQRKITTSTVTFVNEQINFCSTDVQQQCEIDISQVSNQTMRRAIKRDGFSYQQCHKKSHLKKTVKFARKCQKLPQPFWKENLIFLLMEPAGSIKLILVNRP